MREEFQPGDYVRTRLGKAYVVRVTHSGVLVSLKRRGLQVHVSPDDLTLIRRTVAGGSGGRRAEVPDLIEDVTGHSNATATEGISRGRTLEALRLFDLSRLFAHLDRVTRESGTANLSTAMCARGGVGTALLFAKAQGANEVQILKYANSGDVAVGDRRRVVGYGAALFLRRPGE